MAGVLCLCCQALYTFQNGRAASSSSSTDSSRHDSFTGVQAEMQAYKHK